MKKLALALVALLLLSVPAEAARGGRTVVKQRTVVRGGGFNNVFVGSRFGANVFVQPSLAFRQRTFFVEPPPVIVTPAPSFQFNAQTFGGCGGASFSRFSVGF